MQKRMQIDEKKRKDAEINEKNKRKLARLAIKEKRAKDTENRKKKNLKKKLLKRPKNYFDLRLDDENKSGALYKDGIYLNVIETY